MLKKNGFEYVVRSRPRPPGVHDYILTDIQKQILLGEMFGDGGLAYVSDKSSYYHCMHSVTQEKFVLWKHALFSPLSARLVHRTDRYENGRKLFYIGTQTWSSKCLLEYYSRFYGHDNSEGKTMTPELLEGFTALSLAVWYMGDGSINRNTGIFHVGLQINLSPVAVALSDRFGMLFEARKYKREWHLRVMEPSRFFRLISPYLLSIFSYKVPDKYRDLVATNPIANL